METTEHDCNFEERIEEFYIRPLNISFDGDMLAGRELLGLLRERSIYE